MVSTPSDNPTALHTHAVNDLRFIRDVMERSASFTAVPGWGTVLMGCTAILTAFITEQYWETEYWLWIWMIEAGIACTLGFLFMKQKAKRVYLSLYSGSGWRFLLNLFTPILVGIPFTVILYQHDMISILPGAWMSLYGIGVVTGGVFSVRVVPVMGFCFIALGILTLWVPVEWGNRLLGVGFGFFHILFGVIIARRHGG